MISMPHPLPLPEPLWTREAASFVLGLMESRSISFDNLAAELVVRGTDITPQRLEARISGGQLSAGLFFLIMHVLGEEQVKIADVDPYDGGSDDGAEPYDPRDDDPEDDDDED